LFHVIKKYCPTPRFWRGWVVGLEQKKWKDFREKDQGWGSPRGSKSGKSAFGQKMFDSGDVHFGGGDQDRSFRLYGSGDLECRAYKALPSEELPFLVLQFGTPVELEIGKIRHSEKLFRE